MGYDFDITNSTRYDQAYVQNRDIFANISDIVDDIFNEYVYRRAASSPTSPNTAMAPPSPATGCLNGERCL